jgi:hypothetical protein
MTRLKKKAKKSGKLRHTPKHPAVIRSTPEANTVLKKYVLAFTHKGGLRLMQFDDLMDALQMTVKLDPGKERYALLEGDIIKGMAHLVELYSPEIGCIYADMRAETKLATVEETSLLTSFDLNKDQDDDAFEKDSSQYNRTY